MPNSNPLAEALEIAAEHLAYCWKPRHNRQSAHDIAKSLGLPDACPYQRCPHDQKARITAILASTWLNLPVHAKPPPKLK